MKYNTALAVLFLSLSVAVSSRALSSAEGPGRNPVDDARTGRDLAHEEASAVLHMIHSGRVPAALSYLDSLRARSGTEPLYLILRARCYQEFVPMDDADKTTGRALSLPALEDLDRCIEACTKRLDSPSADERLLFYRGWAWMAKAYVRSMTRDLYAAGRDAKKGKRDLERYLAKHPDDPTTLGLLGTFLYFADTLPGAFKVISKILMLPTGDRTKGLEYLARAAQSQGLLQTDWKLILYNVYFYFEGRFEEGLEGLRHLTELHPEYARTAMPLALSRPYAPTLATRNDELVERSIGRIQAASPQDIDWNGLYLLQFLRAYGDRYCNHSSTTEARLRSIIHESPRHPDWLTGSARIELGRLYASRGKREDAAALFRSVAYGYTFSFLRKEAEWLLRDLERFAAYFDHPPLPDTDRWVVAIYSENPDSLSAARSRFASLAPRSLAARFYVAECDLLSGDFDAAVKGFQEVISVEAPAWEHPYQMIASTRIAEIYAYAGFYKTAARYQAIALSYYHNEYLLDWVIEGRRKYFERLSEGKETRAPDLLAANLSRPVKPPQGNPASPLPTRGR